MEPQTLFVEDFNSTRNIFLFYVLKLELKLLKYIGNACILKFVFFFTIRKEMCTHL